jgi:catechol-2,3-dioxygenase
MTAIPVERVNEIVLEVLDLDAAVSFYHEVLGLKLHGRDERRAWIIAGQSRIGLWTPQVGLANGRGGVHVHYAFHLPEEHFDATVRRLADSGLDPEVISFEDEGRGRAVYVTDPDGNVVEFWTYDLASDA